MKSLCSYKPTADVVPDADDSSNSDSFATALQSLDDESIYETATQGSTDETADKSKVDVRAVVACFITVFCLTFAFSGLER